MGLLLVFSRAFISLVAFDGRWTGGWTDDDGVGHFPCFCFNFAVLVGVSVVIITGGQCLGVQNQYYRFTCTHTQDGQ